MKRKAKIKSILSGAILLFILLTVLVSILKTTKQEKQTVNSRAAEINIKPQRWIQPNYHFSFNHPLNTAAWGNYFSNESQITTTLSLIDVYSTWVPEI
ncbi:MAG: hypothetical protein Q7J11_01335, partial [Candidatus Roizmanbacteria bacterium]|nr:hypothetical protein [Candidatus Roizmanbacteria bacterium]